jgi:Putative lumazine-binding
MVFGGVASAKPRAHNLVARTLFCTYPEKFTMQRFALGLAASVLFFATSVIAQDAAPKSAYDDTTAIHDAVRNYIEAYYTGDAPRMRQTLHPHYLKHMIHGDIPMREKTAAHMVREIRSNGGPSDQPQAEKTEQIMVLDVARDIASAKLVTPHWVDYLTLSKLDGQWKILSVVQKIGD